MAETYCYKEVLPLTAMVIVEITNVGVNVLFKAATQKGLSYYAFIVYSFALSTLFLLLPLPFVFSRLRGFPPLNKSLMFRIFLLGVIGLAAQLFGYTGLTYTSPTIFSALSNLIPAFTFILAVIFRMEKVALRTSSTQSKILGSLVSISGALIVVLYKGPIILSTFSSQPSPTVNSPITSTSQTNWVLGGSLVAIEFILAPIWYIVQTSIMKEYPEEFIVVFLFNLSGTLISAPVCLLLEANLSAWKINWDVTLISIIYSGFLCTGLSSLVHTWGIRLKGPVYVSIFKPLSMVIASAMSVIFLGDPLYFGTAIGAVIISFGFYAVIWGKAKEDELSEDFDIHLPSSSKHPLLQSYKVKDNQEITNNNSS